MPKANGRDGRGSGQQGKAPSQLQRELDERGTRLAAFKHFGSLRGMDALHRHLVDAHHWRLDEVRALAPEDIRLLVTTTELEAIVRQALRLAE